MHATFWWNSLISQSFFNSLYQSRCSIDSQTDVKVLRSNFLWKDSKNIWIWIIEDVLSLISGSCLQLTYLLATRSLWPRIRFLELSAQQFLCPGAQIGNNNLVPDRVLSLANCGKIFRPGFPCHKQPAAGSLQRTVTAWQQRQAVTARACYKTWHVQSQNVSQDNSWNKDSD